MATFTAFRGISLYYGDPDDSKVDIRSINVDPTVAPGVAADVDTVAFAPSGAVFVKEGVGDQDWSPQGTVGGLIGTIPFCLADGSDDNIPLKGTKVPFLLADNSEDDIGLV